MLGKLLMALHDRPSVLNAKVLTFIEQKKIEVMLVEGEEVVEEAVHHGQNKKTGLGTRWILYLPKM